MPIQKQNLSLSFATSIDTKTDPLQLAASNMLSLKNVVYTKDKRIQKRNGFGLLITEEGYSAVSTFKGNLILIGSQLSAYSEPTRSIVPKGTYEALDLNVIPTIRTAYTNSVLDSAVSTNGLVCSTFLDGDGSYKYSISDVVTSQQLVGVTPLPTGANLARVTALGNYFVITFLISISATPHLQYIAVPFNAPSSPTTATDISAQVKSTTTGYDADTINDTLYVAWSGSDVGNSIRISYLDSNLNQHNTVILATYTATTISICGDDSQSSPVIWLSFYDSGSMNAYASAYSAQLVSILPPTLYLAGVIVRTITSSATGNVLTVYYERRDNYSFGSDITDSVVTVTVTIAGVVGSSLFLFLNLGLASKAFTVNGVVYFLGTHQSTYQNTYFLCRVQGTTTNSGVLVAKLAYSNGAGYPTTQIISNVSLYNGRYYIGYLFADLLTPVNKTQGVANSAGIYAQTGCNVVSFDFAGKIITAEIGNTLLINGGYLWSYDGTTSAENNFHVWPEGYAATSTTTTGHLAAQIYFYTVTYEWTDAQGNINRSAPGVPLEVDLSGSGTNTNKVTLNIPTLRHTLKTNVRIVIYRWSTAQQIYYQVTSVTSPLLNDSTTNSVQYVDTLADASILGNTILYTTGGVLENIGGPACTTVGLYKNRLFLVTAEDQNLLWFSKQVIEAVPVEMSDVLTYFAAPTVGAQGSTGPTLSIASMDDKFILFKKDASYYFTGQGPDNTGANNDFSDPNFITGIVGCSNQLSIVFQQNGLMFQSDKGIWILERNLNVSYIGAPVEDFNSFLVNGALSIPGTNQIRFTLSGTAETLLYDYFFGRWATFDNTPTAASTLYQGLHTYLSTLNDIRQETPGLYLDYATPVVMSFKTSWFNLAGLQGYERAIFFYILGMYISPHFLNISIAYDYNPSPVQNTIITPANFAGTWGSEASWGAGATWGSTSSSGMEYEGALEQWRIFFDTQRCQAFQLTVQEIYDPSKGVPSGAGLTFSGLNLIYGLKRGFRPGVASRSRS